MTPTFPSGQEQLVLVPSVPYSGGRCPTPAATQSDEKEPRSFPSPPQSVAMSSAGKELILTT